MKRSGDRGVEEGEKGRSHASLGMEARRKKGDSYKEAEAPPQCGAETVVVRLEPGVRVESRIRVGL